MLSSFVKNKNYSGKLLFCKEWRENRIYSIDEKDFIEGNFEEDRLEVTEFKFHSEIEKEGLRECEMFSY